MNYIKKLQIVEKNRTEMVNGLRGYLNSEKFQVDTNVNKNDILMRIQEFEDSLMDETTGK